MKAGWIGGWAVLTLAIWPATAMATPSYTAIILGPAESMAYGIGGGQITGVEGSSPVVWNPSDLSTASLDSTSFPGAWATATDGINQVGNDGDHAILWSGPGSSAIDLTPSGYTHAFAGAVFGQSQGGGVSGPATNNQTNAAIWQGSADSFQNLNPAGYTSSEIVAMTASQQVGWATVTVNQSPPLSPYQVDHAIVWSGSATNYIDLGPGRAYGIFGNIAGGEVGFQAAIWNISTDSVTILHSYDSAIQALAGNFQVGYVTTSSTNYAALWEGTADSLVDLGEFLPSQFTASDALGVDAEGDVVGYAHIQSTNQDYAVLWLAPEPNTLIYSIVLLIPLSIRRRILSFE